MYTMKLLNIIVNAEQIKYWNINLSLWNFKISVELHLSLQFSDLQKILTKIFYFFTVSCIQCILVMGRKIGNGNINHLFDGDVHSILFYPMDFFSRYSTTNPRFWFFFTKQKIKCNLLNPSESFKSLSLSLSHY